MQFITGILDVFGDRFVYADHPNPARGPRPAGGVFFFLERNPLKCVVRAITILHCFSEVQP
jgi:hypothetical protein